MESVNKLWPFSDYAIPFVVCTGGEPLLQLDQTLVDTFKNAGFQIAIETNGTLQPPNGIDWICVSPKAGAAFVLIKGNELKLIFPQKGIDPTEYKTLEFEHFYLQPLDSQDLAENTRTAVNYCLNHPEWKLSLQTHKMLNIP